MKKERHELLGEPIPVRLYLEQERARANVAEARKQINPNDMHPAHWARRALDCAEDTLRNIEAEISAYTGPREIPEHEIDSYDPDAHYERHLESGSRASEICLYETEEEERRLGKL